ncbi:ligand-binding sensor domain-containing diguanylate cyclase [Colwellia psychrerythraea]|uniref:Diguanylate cyclase with beta propeller sensor n=1 Tax=Colwellia psychrerythraea TaxID=28229 RepID=A0A099KWW7_COLPS|nr:ligand-binding sensor domain-containing diguanylate cyclase [Colwellia psychrerythraea]KGJ95229.1 diguanylate cyclase with beta propeller sensor [Colwellia psychrerythraea]
MLITKDILLVIFLLFLAPIASFAQAPNIRFQQISFEQGLSQEAVLTVFQDSDGFMWFGTQEGLNRYDGYSFKVYTKDESNSDSIGSDIIFALAEDYLGELWVGTEYGGLNHFDKTTQKFVRFTHNPDDVTSISNSTVRAIFSDINGNLWLGTDGGLNLFNHQSKQFERFVHDPLDDNSVSSNKVRTLVGDSQGYLWIGTDGGGVDRFDPITKTFRHYQHDENNPSSIASNRIKSSYADSQGNLWFGSYDKGVSRLTNDRKKFDHFSHSEQNPNSIGNNYIRNIIEDSEGNLWFATDKGLSRWRPNTDDMITLLNDPLDKYSIGSNKVTSLYFDKGGIFWVGTYSGLNKWNSATAAFRHLRHQPNLPISLSDNGVNAITQSRDGNLWIGTYGGLNMLSSTGITQFHAQPDNKNSLSEERIMSLHSDENNHLWIGTRNSGFDRFAPATNTFTNYRHDAKNQNSVSSNAVTAITPRIDGRLWIATFGGGLDLFDPVKNQFTHFANDANNTKSLSSNNILCLADEDDGRLWVGTYGGGLNLFDPISNTSTVYKNEAGQYDSISSNNIMAIFQDKKKNLWIGTQGGGLNKISFQDRLNSKLKFTRYNRHNGLPSNTIYGILEDSNGNLWLSTNHGLTQFNPDTGKVLNFDSSHGLQGNEFNAGAFYKDPQDNFYFGGTNGLTIFNPVNIKPNSHVPPVVLTRFLKMNKTHLENSGLRNLNGIEIRYEDYFVAFEFAGLDFAEPSNNRYRYILEGFDEDWVEAGSLRRATYTNLPAGQYTFKVKAANNDGVWNEQGVRLAVVVQPPMWKSWWAYLIYTMASIGFIIMLIKIYLNKLKKEALYRLKLESEVQNRTRELQTVNQKLLNTSVTDQLTGLHNRRYLDDIIDKEVADIDREYYSDNGDVDNVPLDNEHRDCPRLFFLMFDLDGFKPVNDTYGHSAGDKVLVDISLLLKAACRKSDTVIRWGGDEFLMMGKVNNIDEVSSMAERLRKSIQDCAFDIGLNQKLHLSCSIGFSFYPFSAAFPKSVNWEQVQVIADKALYRSKELGRNKWVGIVDTQIRPPVSFMSMLTQDLHKVIELGCVKLIEHSDIPTNSEGSD